MVLLRQLATIIGICFLGEFLNKVLNIPVPANVLGMMILLFLLMTGLINLDKIDKISKFLLDHLAFIFVPAGVSILKNLELIKDHWMPIIAITMISTVIVMVVTGLTIQFLIRRWSA